MPQRPWVFAEQIREYTDYPAVKERSDAKLCVDISRAEQYVISYTGNDFLSMTCIPDSVITAVILIAEMYAYNSTLAGQRKKKSETFDDYSYTLADDNGIEPDSLGLPALLDGFKVVRAGGKTVMRMRKL